MRTVPHAVTMGQDISGMGLLPGSGSTVLRNLWATGRELGCRFVRLSGTHPVLSGVPKVARGVLGAPVVRHPDVEAVPGQQHGQAQGEEGVARHAAAVGEPEPQVAPQH